MKKLNFISYMGICSLLSFGLFFITGCKKSSITPEQGKPEIDYFLAGVSVLPADGVSSTTITAKLIWPSNDAPAVGYQVNFATNLGTITPLVDTTDSNGIATATLTSDTIAGTARVTLNCDADNSPWRLHITFTQISADSVYIASFTADPTSIVADGISISNITAILKYISSGNSASGLPVTFTSSRGSITPSDTTDTNGTATAVLTSDTTAGTALVEIVYSTLRDTVEVYFIASGTGGDTIPASIVVYSIDNSSIGVKGSGDNETSTMLFQIRDKSGYPVSGTHKVDFTIVGGPGGGEYLYPDSAISGDSALVTTHLNSGTESGTVRIIATVRGTSISSAPVKVVIVGGPPAQGHFTVAIDKLNTYTLWESGTATPVKAYVGDQYGNPVPDNTVVWFSTTCGIVQPGEGYAVEGVASNTLISCGPWPSNGFFYLYGETRDGAGNTIKDSVNVLWTYRTILIVSPDSFSIPNAGSQDFTIDLYDVNRNPLAEGTVLTVSSSIGEVRGDIDITIPDTQDSTWAHFSFILLDDTPDTTDTRSGKVTIDVSSPNGAATEIIYGTID